MSLLKINMYDDKFLYRCEDCGYESHYRPVREHELGPPPHHSCAQARRAHMNAAFEQQEMIEDSSKQ